MSIITRMLIQDAVYWPPDELDDNGQPTYGDPQEIRVRWEDRAEQFVQWETGGTALSRSVVYTSVDVEVRGVLLLGELSSGVVQDNPKSNEGAWEIRRFDKLPNLRGSEYLRTAYL